MSTVPAFTKHQLQANLIEKCWKDPEFRAEVLKDPKGMLEAFLGKSLPADFQVHVHEEDAKTLHLALPPLPSLNTELSDEELERLAGGTELVLALTAVTADVVTM